MIDAFLWPPSARAGERVTLHVRADEPSRLRIARAGSRAEPMPEYQGIVFDEGEHDVEIEVPQSWRSGAFVFVFERAHETVIRLDARDARALLIVRPSHPQSRILYNIPIFTYQAYNVGQDVESERTCLYNDARSVTLRRCGGGVGGHLWDEVNVDVYDPETPRQTIAHWDAHAIAWLERSGYDVDYCTDLDVHREPALLNEYRLFLAFGHHEYWTEAMRAHLDAHIGCGRNAAFFAGNTCFFRITYDEASARITRDGRWDDDPEDRTFGLSYRFGGGKWSGGRPPTGYFVTAPSHWVFDACELSAGGSFGEDERIVGYECDGSPDVVPEEFCVVAQSSIAGWPVNDGSGEINGRGNAALCVRERSGTMFSAGTVDWARALASCDPAAIRITANVINRLSQS